MKKLKSTLKFHTLDCGFFSKSDRRNQHGNFNPGPPAIQTALKKGQEGLAEKC